MALPDLLEIIPLDKPVRAEITVPGSKSITNRALILAALADGEVTLEGALWSEDTQIMTEALRTLGFEIKVEPDPEEFCNRRIAVKGLDGNIPNAGTPGKPLELFVGNAGTAARFLAALVCLGNEAYRLSGVPRMHERPQAALFKALRELGYRVDSPNDKLPATIFGRDAFHSVPDPKRTDGDAVKRVPTERVCTVSIEESSQFASALLLCAKQGGWEVRVVGENAEESPYVAMTAKLIEAFPNHGGKFQIEPDASSGSYFWPINHFAPFRIFEVDTEEEAALYREPTDWKPNPQKPGDRWPYAVGRSTTPNRFGVMEMSSVCVRNWPKSNWQVDSKFVNWLRCNDSISRKTDLGDSIMTAIVAVAPFTGTSHFTDLARLRVQECDRVAALRAELTKCGLEVIEGDDSLTLRNLNWVNLHGAEIETYNDHRMAMCFAILGLKVPGIKIKNPACVKKTFPNFFQKLAAPPPKGLGAEIRDAKTGRKLEVDELFAD